VWLRRHSRCESRWAEVWSEPPARTLRLSAGRVACGGALGGGLGVRGSSRLPLVVSAVSIPAASEVSPDLSCEVDEIGRHGGCRSRPRRSAVSALGRGCRSIPPARPRRDCGRSCRADWYNRPLTRSGHVERLYLLANQPSLDGPSTAGPCALASATFGRVVHESAQLRARFVARDDDDVVAEFAARIPELGRPTWRTRSAGPAP
jgi:hypothetical protein